jgi:hypothetical protein
MLSGCIRGSLRHIELRGIDSYCRFHGDWPECLLLNTSGAGGVALRSKGGSLTRSKSGVHYCPETGRRGWLEPVSRVNC